MPQKFLVLTEEELQQIIKSTVAEYSNITSTNLKQSTPIVYLTRREAVKYLRTSYPTLQKHTKSGLIRCETFGRKKLYNQEELNLAIPRFNAIQGDRKTKARMAS